MKKLLIGKEYANVVMGPHQKSSPILIGDNSKQNFDSIKYWTIPGINAIGQMFIRMPDSCLIESLLSSDINSLVDVVNHQNRYMENIVSNFGQLAEGAG